MWGGYCAIGSRFVGRGDSFKRKRETMFYQDCTLCEYLIEEGLFENLNSGA